MKRFLIKHKKSILSWIIFVSIVVYFIPKQNDYYLDKDIDNFKTKYLLPILLWVGGIVGLAALVLIIVKTKSIKNALVAFIKISLALAFYLFIFRDLLLAGSLFVNREFETDKIQRNYLATFMAGTPETKDNFIPYDLKEKQISIDRKLINKLYKTGLKQNDTIPLRFSKGILGIAFQSQQFDDR